MIPGEIINGHGDVTIDAGRPRTSVRVVNTADRPVQVGSHYHFGEANPALEFDRAAARGQRLAVPAGTSVRFEPGVPRDVELVPLAGRRVVAGLRGETAGPLDTGQPAAQRPDGEPATRRVDDGPAAQRVDGEPEAGR